MSLQIVTIDRSHLKGPKPEITCPNEGWVAGGAIRRWFSNAERLSDVDLFFQNEKALATQQAYLKDKGAQLTAENANSVTYLLNDTIIQCICLRFFATLPELFETFDFTLCQFAWDGEKVVASVDGMLSVLRNHLGVHKLTKEHAVDSLRRSFKYAKKGFFPCNGTLMDLANALTGLTAEEIKNAVEISPGGGKRIIRID